MGEGTSSSGFKSWMPSSDCDGQLGAGIIINFVIARVPYLRSEMGN